jgi:hypothetical protein
MNDPLLNPAGVIPPAPKVTRTPKAATRKKHPAMSARILAAGLSATALIGLTTGYTLSQKVAATQPVVSNNTVINASLNSPIDAGVIIPTSRVVYVPVPGVAAAKAGTPTVKAPAPVQTTQKSSGSK